MSKSETQVEDAGGSKSEDCERESAGFSHDVLVKLTKEAIAKIIESDPFFKHLPLDPTVDEIKAQIAVVHGQAITLYLDRTPLPRLSIVVRI